MKWPVTIAYYLRALMLHLRHPPFYQFIQLKKHLPQGIMQSFFAINVMLDLHSATELMMTTIGELQKVFPTSVHLKASRALVLYHMRGGWKIVCRGVADYCC